MASASYQHSILYRGEDPATARFKPKKKGEHAAKAFRHRAGEVPTFFRKEKEEEEAKEAEEARKREQQQREQRKFDTTGKTREREPETKRVLGGLVQSRAMHLAGTQVYESVEDRMAKRRKLQQAQELDSDSEQGPAPAAVLPAALQQIHVKAQQKAIGGESSGGESDSEDSSSIDEEEAKLKEKQRLIALQRAKAQEAALKIKEQGPAESVLNLKGPSARELDETDSESSSAEESSSEGPGKQLAKPVYVPKGLRATERLKEEKLIAEQKAAQEERILKEQKKEEARNLVAAKVQQEMLEDEVKQRIVHSESEYSLDSDLDETPAAFDEWKIRELERVLHLEKLKDERCEEIEQLARRRNMTEEEKLEDDKRLDEEAREKGITLLSEKGEKLQHTHMQKYHHRGGYYQDIKQTGGAAADEKTARTAELLNRNVHEPLASEKYDKSLLPKSMQVRRGMYGMRGQQKHTNLKEADTTDWSSAWIDPKQREKRERFEQMQRDKNRERDEKIADMRKMGER